MLFVSAPRNGICDDGWSVRIDATKQCLLIIAQLMTAEELALLMYIWLAANLLSQLM